MANGQKVIELLGLKSCPNGSKDLNNMDLVFLPEWLEFQLPAVASFQIFVSWLDIPSSLTYLPL